MQGLGEVEVGKAASSPGSKYKVRSHFKILFSLPRPAMGLPGYWPLVVHRFPSGLFVKLAKRTRKYGLKLGFP